MDSIVVRDYNRLLDSRIVIYSQDALQLMADRQKGCVMEVVYSLAELSSLSGIPSRRIRSYIQQGLVPKPVGNGRRSRYGEAHRATLQVVEQLRQAHLPLDVIREYLNDLDPTHLRAPDPVPPTAGPKSAADGAAVADAPVAEDDAGRTGPFRGLKGPRLAAAVMAFVTEKRESASTVLHESVLPGGGQVGGWRAGDGESTTVDGGGSVWRRFSLSPDVELHVRTSYLVARSADARRMSGDGAQTSEGPLDIVLDALMATVENGAPHPFAAVAGQERRQSRATSAQPPSTGAAQGTYGDATTKGLVFSALIEAAVRRGTLRYADVANIMGIALRGQSMGMKAGGLLDEICEDEVRDGRPMLSALVVGYTGRPGKGFFALAQALGRLADGEDQAQFWTRELEAVYETWQRRGARS